MRRHPTVVAAALTATASLVLAGCGSGSISAQWRAPAGIVETGEPTSSATSMPTPPANAPSSLSKAERTLSVEGVGPFKIGTSTIGSLDEKGLVTLVEPYFPEFCNGIVQASGAGDWIGLVTLYFKAPQDSDGSESEPTPTAAALEPSADAVLVAVVTLHSDIISASGAHVGMTGDQVQQIYKSKVEVSEGYGGTTVYTVNVDDSQHLVMLQTDPGSNTISEIFAQRGEDPPLIPRDGPAC